MCNIFEFYVPQKDAVNTLDDYIMVLDNMVPQNCINDLMKDYKSTNA
jgi:hypothetical protein